MVIGRSLPVVHAIDPRLVTIACVGPGESVHTLDAVEWLLQSSLSSWSMLGRLPCYKQGRTSVTAAPLLMFHSVSYPLGRTQPCLDLRAFSDAQLQDESSWIHQLAASLAPAFCSVGSKPSLGVGMKMERLHHSPVSHPPSPSWPLSMQHAGAELMVFM